MDTTKQKTFFDKAINPIRQLIALYDAWGDSIGFAIDRLDELAGKKKQFQKMSKLHLRLSTSRHFRKELMKLQVK